MQPWILDYTTADHTSSRRATARCALNNVLGFDT